MSVQDSFVTSAVLPASRVSQVAQDLLALGSAASAQDWTQSQLEAQVASQLNAAQYGAANQYSAANQYVANQSVAVQSSANNQFSSGVEQAILRSLNPIEINESEEINVLGQRGVWANRAEVVNWRGPIPISEYQINQDQNPEIINKRVQQNLEYVQELAIRYLRPPTPPAPGEIFIQQEPNTLTPPAPPLVIRQQPARPDTPEPLVVREAPPAPPRAVGRKVITIAGRRLPPPPRKVIIERLAPLPAKPQSVLVERWLPYAQVKRRVVFQRSNQPDPQIVAPRNVIVQWEAPQVTVKRDVKYLGVVRANPVEYVQRYGTALRVARDLPQIVLDIKAPEGVVLASEYQYNEVHELEGDLQALKLVDLDREGLAEYKSQLGRLGFSQSYAAAPVSNVAVLSDAQAQAYTSSSWAQSGAATNFEYAPQQYSSASFGSAY